MCLSALGDPTMSENHTLHSINVSDELARGRGRRRSRTRPAPCRNLCVTRSCVPDFAKMNVDDQRRRTDIKRVAAFNLGSEGWAELPFIRRISHVHTRTT